MSSDIKDKKGKRNPTERLFIVKESYAGKKNLSDIFADLLLAYCEREPDDKCNELNRNGYLPNHQSGQTQLRRSVLRNYSFARESGATLSNI